jgi:hypothetical protein
MRPALRQILFGPPGWVRALSPGAVPSLALDFANARYWNGQVRGAPDAIPGWSFSRTGVEYEATSSGLLVPFGSGVPAVTDLGLQVWEARTNLATNTNINPASTAGMVKTGDAAATLSVVTDAAALASIGLSGNIYKLDNSAGSTSASAFWSSAATVASTTYTASAYVRGTGSGGIVQSDIGGSTAALTAGYTRATRTGVASTTGNQGGVTVTAGSVVYFILNQLEQATFAGPGIPVAGASATRGAASASVGGLSLPAPATVYVEFNLGQLGAGGADEVLFGGVAGMPSLAISSSGTLTSSARTLTGLGSTANTYTPGGLGKAAFRYQSGSSALCLNGGAVASNASTFTPAASGNVGIGYDAQAGGSAANGIIRLVVLYPSALTNAQLQQLTT